jgi:anti-sigma B factor antagonist
VVDPAVQEHDFRLHVERGLSDAPVIAVAGDVDLHSAPELRDQLAELTDDGAPRVVLDLSRVTCPGSMALGVLLGAKKRLAANGG